MLVRHRMESRDKVNLRVVASWTIANVKAASKTFSRTGSGCMSSGSTRNGSSKFHVSWPLCQVSTNIDWRCYQMCSWKFQWTMDDQDENSLPFLSLWMGVNMFLVEGTIWNFLPPKLNTFQRKNWQDVTKLGFFLRKVDNFDGNLTIEFLFYTFRR